MAENQLPEPNTEVTAPKNRTRLLVGVLVGSAVVILSGLFLTQGFVPLLLGLLVGARTAAVSKTSTGAVVGAWIGVIGGAFIGYRAAESIFRQAAFPPATVVQMTVFDMFLGAILSALIGAGLGAVIGRVAKAMAEGKRLFW